MLDNGIHGARLFLSYGNRYGLPVCSPIGRKERQRPGIFYILDYTASRSNGHVVSIGISAHWLDNFSWGSDSFFSSVN
jgi:hypothetical protein